MLARDRQMGVAENRIDIRYRSATDESERATGDVMELSDERLQLSLEDYLRRRRRDVYQCAVNVEEICPRAEWCGELARLARGERPTLSGSFHAKGQGLGSMGFPCCRSRE